MTAFLYVYPQILDLHTNVKVYYMVSKPNQEVIGLRIGKVSKLTGVSARSIRHYEEKGLINTSRQENNYRDEKVIESINTIQLYLGLGLTTDQIKDKFV